MIKPQSIERIAGQGKPTHAIIWLHGLGATADDFVPVIPHLGLASSPTIRFIFPQAPDRPITVNGGMFMPGWHDVKGEDLSDKEDLVGMTASQHMVNTLIDQQIAAGVPSKNIIIAGFSQGGAVAYHAGLRSPHALAGILALSTYLLFPQALKDEQSGVNKETPIMVMHGLHDPVVPLALGKQSAAVLTELGYSVAWKDYPMDHSVVPEQLVDIGAWINSVFGPTGA